MSDAERLTELEIRLSYLEDTLNALDQVIARQAEDIVRLEGVNKIIHQQLLGLRERLDEVAPGEGEQPPPHY
jgi:SlyX protein